MEEKYDLGTQFDSVYLQFLGDNTLFRAFLSLLVEDFAIRICAAS